MSPRSRASPGNGSNVAFNLRNTTATGRDDEHRAWRNGTSRRTARSLARRRGLGINPQSLSALMSVTCDLSTTTRSSSSMSTLRLAHGLHMETLAHDAFNRVGSRRDKNIPGLEDGRELVDIEVFRVDQHLAGGKWRERGIDMHRLTASALELVNPEPAAEMPAQPFDAHPIGHIAARHEQISSTTHEVGGVEDRLELVDHKARRLGRHSDAVVVIKQLIGELRFRCGGPACTFQEVLLEQGTIGVCLEIARAPTSRRLDDFVADDHENVTWAGGGETPRRPMRRVVLAGEVDDVGSPNPDAFTLKKMDELVEFALGKPDHPFWVTKASSAPKDLRGERRQIRSDGDVVWGKRGPLKPSDDHFLKRIPLSVGVDRDFGLLW